MEAMAGLIMQFGGVVDSYAGDGIKADFGVPIPRDTPAEIRSDAVNAVSCALAMEEEMSRLNAVWGARGLPEVGVRVGIFTGPVVGGLLGSSQRLKYTTIGDTVNIASRLESFDKDLARHSLCRILIGDQTLECLEGQYETVRIGEVKLKGKDQAIVIHQVLGRSSSVPGAHSPEVIS
jgi:adenylate cyclase